MKNKIRLFIGWFGVLTPVYAAGALTVLFTFGDPDMAFVGRVLLVSGINFFIGRKILKAKMVAKEVKRYGNSNPRRIS